MSALFCFTLRQMLGQRKLWLVGALLLFPAGVVLLARAVGAEPGPRHLWEMYHVLMQFVLIMALMPLVCLLYGTALIGAEVEQRTLVYLITRRLRRATVLLVRFVATWIVLSALFAVAMLALHVCVTLHGAVATVAAAGSPWQPWQDLRVYLAIAPAGAAGFLAVFTTISLAFGRPLVISIVYVVGLELVLGNLPVPVRRLSISHPLRQTMLQQIPGVQRLYELPAELVDLVYPAGQSGTATLLATIAVLLICACTLMTFRELVPARIGRD